MNELRRRLQEVVEARYDSSQAQASLAAGLNPNAVNQILKNPKRIPALETLDLLARTFGWALEDVVYWALGRERPSAVDAADDPLRIIAVQLARLGFDETSRAALMHTVGRLAELAAAERESSGGGP